MIKKKIRGKSNLIPIQNQQSKEAESGMIYVYAILGQAVVVIFGTAGSAAVSQLQGLSLV